MKKHFDLVSIGVLIVLGPLFVFPKEKWNWLLLAAVAVLFLSRGILERTLLPKTPLDAAIGLLLIMAGAGIFVIPEIGPSLDKLAGLVYGIVVFFLLLETLKTPRRMKWALLGFLAAGLFLAVFGTLARTRNWKPVSLAIEAKIPKLPRFDPGLKGAEVGINPNPLGGTLLLFFPLGVMQIFILGKRNNVFASGRRKGFLFAALAFLLVIQALAVFYSRSLGAWFSLALALWLMGERKRPLKAVTAVVLLALALGLPFMRSEPNQVLDQRILSSLTHRGEYRALIWKNAWEVVRAHPLFGIGLDRLRRTPPFTYHLAHAHNQFLHTAAELGVPGLIAYVAILIGIFWMMGEVRKSSLPEWLRLTSRGLGAGIFAHVVFGMGDAIPLGAKPGIFFWISLALITSIYIYGRNHGFMSFSEPRAEHS